MLLLLLMSLNRKRSGEDNGPSAYKNTDKCPTSAAWASQRSDFNWTEEIKKDREDEMPRLVKRSFKMFSYPG